jgi:hypothetical protein
LDDKHREQSGFNDTGRKTNVEDDQLDKTARMSAQQGHREAIDLPLARHEHSNGTRLSVIMTDEFGGDRATEEFTKPSDRTDEDSVSPISAGIEQTQVRGQPR